MNCLLIWAIEKLDTYLNYKCILDPLSKAFMMFQDISKVL